MAVQLDPLFDASQGNLKLIPCRALHHPWLALAVYAQRDAPLPFLLLKPCQEKFAKQEKKKYDLTRAYEALKEWMTIPHSYHLHPEMETERTEE